MMKNNVFPEDTEFIERTRKQIKSLGSKAFLSKFLFPWEISLTRHALKETEATIDEWGGYDNAIKKRVLGTQRRIKQSMFRINKIAFKPHSMLRYSNRKSVIDAFNSNGVTGDSLGDIIHGSDAWYIMIDSEFRDLEFADAEITPLNEIPKEYLKRRQDDITNTTSSVRLDSICAIAFKPSRGKLKGLIENGGAMVDYDFVLKAGREISEGSLISLRGFPRFRLSKIGDETKKGRTRVTIEFLD